MADNWDSAYPDFQIPATAAPNQPAPQQPQIPGANNSAWDQGYPNFELPTQPTKQVALPAEKDMPIFDPVSGVTYNPSDPNGPMRSAGGFMAAGGEAALAGPQLLAHGAAAISPSLSGPANTIDKAINWLAAPGSEDYNLGRQAGTYSMPALTWPMAAMNAPKALSFAMPTLFSLLTRPVENAEQGYGERKTEQTAVDTASGLIGKAANAVFGKAAPTTVPGTVTPADQAMIDQLTKNYAGQEMPPYVSDLINQLKNPSSVTQATPGLFSRAMSAASNYMHSHPGQAAGGGLGLAALAGSVGHYIGELPGHALEFMKEHPYLTSGALGLATAGKALSTPIGPALTTLPGSAYNQFSNSGDAPTGLLPYLTGAQALPF